MWCMCIIFSYRFSYFRSRYSWENMVWVTFLDMGKYATHLNNGNIWEYLHLKCGIICWLWECEMCRSAQVKGKGYIKCDAMIIGIGLDWTWLDFIFFHQFSGWTSFKKKKHQFSPSEFFEFLEFLECLNFLAGDVIKKLFEEAGVGSWEPTRRRSNGSMAVEYQPSLNKKWDGWSLDFGYQLGRTWL